MYYYSHFTKGIYLEVKQLAQGYPIIKQQNQGSNSGSLAPEFMLYPYITLESHGVWVQRASCSTGAQNFLPIKFMNLFKPYMMYYLPPLSKGEKGANSSKPKIKLLILFWSGGDIEFTKD